MEFILGTVFVAVYAMNRFGQYADPEFPPPPRLSTTAFRYYRSLFMYVAWTIAIFLTLALVPTALLIATMLPTGTPASIKLTVPPVAIAVVVLTLLFPRLPLLREVDKSIQRFLRGLAQIPARARSIRAWILDAQYRAQSDDSHACELESELAHVANARWRRSAIRDLVAARCISHTLATETRFAEFCDQESEKLQKLEGDIERIKRLVLALPDQPPELAAAGASELGIETESRQILTQAATLLSRAVLITRMSDYAAEQFVKNLGFRSEQAWPSDRRDITDIISLVVLIVFVLLLLVLVYTSVEGRSADNPAVKALMISLVYAAGIGVPAVILYAQTQSGAPDPRRRNANIGMYVFAVVLAVAADQAVRFTFKFLADAAASRSLDHGAQFALIELKTKWGYTILTIANALMTAIVLDLSPLVPEHRWRRWLESALYTVVSVLAGLLVWEVLGPSARPTIPQHIFLIVVGGLGCILGLLVPSLYRDRLACHATERRLGLSEASPAGDDMVDGSRARRLLDRRAAEA